MKSLGGRRELPMSTGVITMAYGPPRYLRMAKGMVRSLRLHRPEMQVAIVSDRNPRALLRWFDTVIPLEPQFGPGLAHKLNLDRYTPFEETLFVDCDFLFFRDPQLLWEEYRQVPGFALMGYYLAPGEEHYAINDLPSYMAELGLSRMLMTNTGVLYFDRSARAQEVFDTTRAIAARAGALGVESHPAGFYNDEPMFASAVELLGQPFISTTERPTFTLAHLGTEGMLDINVWKKRSRYIAGGREFEPILIHFNLGSQESRVYDRELRRLEFGRILGRTPLPDVITAHAWGTLWETSLAKLRHRFPDRMERYWNRRAREDPFRFVDNSRWVWDDDVGTFWKTGEQIVDQLLSGLGVALAGDEDVVEIGCGVGRLTRSLARRARSVQALDVSQEMLTHARRLNPQLANVEWRHGDGRTLTAVTDSSVDVCVSFVVFQHLPDPELTYGYVREMGRVLRPGGWSAFQVSNDPKVHHRPPIWKRLRGRNPGRAYRSAAWRGSAVEIPRLREVAAEAGLEMERLTNEGTQFCTVLMRRP